MNGCERARQLPPVVMALSLAMAAAGCDPGQEDRAAQNASQAVRSANQALTKAEGVAREGVREAGQLAQKAASAAKEGAQESGRLFSDGGLTAKVKTALLADHAVTGTRIDVDSDGGVVTLTGRLPNQAQVERALAIARGIEGVERVENRLTAEAAG